jgi:hypothetical protein
METSLRWDSLRTTFRTVKKKLTVYLGYTSN